MLNVDCIFQRVDRRPLSVDVTGPAADLQYKLPSPVNTEHLAGDVTPAAVLNAFHRYRLHSVNDGGLGLRSNQTSAVMPAARTRPAVKERNDSGVVKKPGELLWYF